MSARSGTICAFSRHLPGSSGAGRILGIGTHLSPIGLTILLSMRASMVDCVTMPVVLRGTMKLQK